MAKLLCLVIHRHLRFDFGALSPLTDRQPVGKNMEVPKPNQLVKLLTSSRKQTRQHGCLTNSRKPRYDLHITVRHFRTWLPFFRLSLLGLPLASLSVAWTCSMSKPGLDMYFEACS